MLPLRCRCVALMEASEGKVIERLGEPISKAIVLTSWELRAKLRAEMQGFDMKLGSKPYHQPYHRKERSTLLLCCF